ncbi:MAG: helix-turn-helix transcriptional regulator, partial [Clostridia bacterium]|nr:helix-turn-helix transcriptional regulator [Clostridia bacterium]
TQEQLSEKLGISRSAVAKWETDNGIPDISNLIALSDEFGLSLDELIIVSQSVAPNLHQNHTNIVLLDKLEFIKYSLLFYQCQLL